MKKTRTAPERAKKARAGAEAAQSGFKPWQWALGVALAFGAALAVYEPALGGAFVLDDNYLPFTGEEFAHSPLLHWIRGQRPLLMLSYWVNFRSSGLETFSYHFVNVVLHTATAVLCLLIVRNLLGRAGQTGRTRDGLAAFAGALFLLHPIQTESVAYVASRSETLSVLFFYAAFVLFLYRRKEAISWLEAIGVLALFAAAANTKEHTATLPLLLLLTDYWWSGFSFQGIRRNWRVYSLVLAGTALALRMVWHVLRIADTAGFSVKNFTWYQYFFTQGRVIWLYIRMFFLPYGLNVDHDFPASYTVLEHGAIFYMLALAAATGAAIWYRRRAPLACYGFLVFLLLLAPTSSFVPIADVVAERRMYLPFFGMALVVVELALRWKAGAWVKAAALGAVLVVLAGATTNRAAVWSTPRALWQDAVDKSPDKSRPRFQLAYTYFADGDCKTAVEQYEIAGRAARHDYRLLVDWALALECAGRHQDALDKLTQAAGIRENAHVESLIGLVYYREGKRAEALAALERAAQLNPNFDMTYVYRAALYADAGDLNGAAAEYRRALSLNPENDAAREGLAILEQRMRTGR